VINLIRFNQLVTAILVLSFFTVAVTSLNISPAKTSSHGSTEYLVAYAEKVNVDTTGTFELYVGVYSDSQGFIGSKYIEYYDTAAPNFRQNVTTDAGQLTAVSWDLTNSPGYHTINITFESQIVPIQVIAGDPLTTGSYIPSFTAIFDNSFPSVGADNNANLDFTVPDAPFIHLIGSEIFSTETTILIDAQPHNLVLGFAESISGFYFEPVNVIIPFTIPIWGQAGTSLPIDIRFSGSSLYDSLVNSYSLPLRVPGQDLSISLPQGVAGGDRSSFGETTNTIDLNVEVSGDNPDNTSLTIKFQLPGYPDAFFLSDYEIIDFISTVPFSIPHDQPLGNGLLIAELSKDSVIQDVKQLNFTVFDELAVSLSFSSEILVPNQSVDILVYTYQEDSYLPESASVDIYDDSALITPIISLVTNSNGQNTVNYVIPEVSSGVQNWWVLVQPSVNSSYQGQTIIWPVNIFSDTQIDVNSDLHILNRGEDATLTAQVSTGASLVNDGMLDLIYHDTNELITEFDLATMTEANILFQIDQDFPKGITYLRWDYHGTDVFSPAQYIIGLHVYSQPIFKYITMNQSYLLPGDPVSIHGYLLQEDSQNSLLDGITTIELWEINSSGAFLIDTFATTETGEFTYDYIVPSDTTIGIHSYQLRFPGDDSLFLRSSQNQPLLDLQVRAEMAIIWDIPSESGYILGGQTLETTVFGRPGLIYEIAYSTDELLDNGGWQTLGQIQFTITDQQNLVLNLPDIKGPITLRLLETQSGVFDYYPLTLYLQPEVSLDLPGSVIGTYGSTEITISSSESFKFRLDGFYIYPPEQTFNGEFLWEYNFTEAGEHLIHVEAIGSYLAQHVFEFPITVYESVNIELLTVIDSPISEGSYETLTFRITNNNGIPLSNVHIQLVTCFSCTDGFTNSDQVLAEGFTSTSGELTIQPQIIGNSFAISLPGDENRYILPLVQEIMISTEQILELDVDLNAFQITEGTSKDLNLKLGFQYNNQLADSVLLRILVIDSTNSGEVLLNFTIMTGKNGDITINLGKGLKIGDYEIKIISEDSRYQPFTFTETLHIVPAPTIVDQVVQGLWLLPVTGIAMIGFGTAGTKLRNIVIKRT